MAKYYCKKCGRVISTYQNNEEEFCDYCESLMYTVPKEYLFDNLIITENGIQKLREELVKPSPEFDKQLYEQRDEVLSKRFAESQAQLAIGKAMMEEEARMSQCPSCQSTNISKIGIINRAISTHFLGLASSKIGKTHKCNNCGTMW